MVLLLIVVLISGDGGSGDNGGDGDINGDEDGDDESFL